MTPEQEYAFRMASEPQPPHYPMTEFDENELLAIRCLVVAWRSKIEYRTYDTPAREFDVVTRRLLEKLDG